MADIPAIRLTLEHLHNLIHGDLSLDSIDYLSIIPFRNYNQPHPLKARWEVGFIIREADIGEEYFKVFLYPDVSPKTKVKLSHSEIWDKREWELSDARTWHNGKRLEESVKEVDKRSTKMEAIKAKLRLVINDEVAAAKLAAALVNGKCPNMSPTMLEALGLNDIEIRTTSP